MKRGQLYGDSFKTGVWSSGHPGGMKTWVLGMSINLEGTSGQSGWWGGVYGAGALEHVVSGGRTLNDYHQKGNW